MPMQSVDFNGNNRAGQNVVLFRSKNMHKSFAVDFIRIQQQINTGGSLVLAAVQRQPTQVYTCLHRTHTHPPHTLRSC